jgi:hypothetical protein
VSRHGIDRVSDFGFNRAHGAAALGVRPNPKFTWLFPLRTFLSWLFFQGPQAELHAFQNYS